MEFLTLTNNPQVIRMLCGKGVVPVEGGVDEVYRQARDLVHQGYRLLTHPLSSSLKPGRIPYKTVVLTAKPGVAVDLASLNLMAAAFDALAATRPQRPLNFSPEILADYAQIDLSVFQSALESLQDAP
ncbi:MAG: GrdX family protein [bacterium]|jgi:hypothetical protein